MHHEVAPDAVASAAAPGDATVGAAFRSSHYFGVDSLPRDKTETKNRPSITRLALSTAVRSLLTRHQIGATPGVVFRFSPFAGLSNYWRHACVG